MGLREELQNARRGRQREPFRPSAFTVVSAIVRGFRLKETFLAAPKNLAARFLEDCRSLGLSPAKEPLEPPLFSLVDPEEYRLTRAILEKLDNPYLAFARSPEELLLSGPLFAQNPGLSAEELSRRHFASLLATEPGPCNPPTSLETTHD